MEPITKEPLNTFIVVSVCSVCTMNMLAEHCEDANATTIVYMDQWQHESFDFGSVT